MPCIGRYAEAWEFAAFFCLGSLLSREDDSGVDNKAYVQDSQMDFVTAGVRANVGMILYNLTDGSSGPVTAVTAHTITATLSGGTDNDFDNGDHYRIVTLDASEIATIETFLNFTASDIHAALAASGACDCVFASWALGYLKKINIIEAGAFHNCPCAKPHLSDAQRQNYVQWSDHQLELIRQQKIELCAGATGSEFPSVDWAEQGTTEFNQAEIILNDSLRDVP